MTRYLTLNPDPQSPQTHVSHYSGSPILAGLNVGMDDEGRLQIGPGIQQVEIRAGNGLHSLYAGQVLTAFSPPFAGTWTAWRMLAPWNSSTSVTIDILRDTYTNWPPTDGDTICGTDRPVLTSARKNEATTVAGLWTTNFDAGDVFIVKVDAASDPGPLGVVLCLTYKRR